MTRVRGNHASDFGGGRILIDSVPEAAVHRPGAYATEQQVPRGSAILSDPLFDRCAELLGMRIFLVCAGVFLLLIHRRHGSCGDGCRY